MTAMLCALLITAGAATTENPKRILFVTHSGGFIHDSVGTAEDVLKEIAPQHGFSVTCWRYTGDPADPKFLKYKEDFRARAGKTIDPENCGRINAQTLKGFDVVLFFTTGTGPKKNNIGPLTDAELNDLLAWVRAGGAFAGVHCASDTLYDTRYGSFLGGYFKSHPSIQEVTLKLEDPKHPAAAGLTDGMKFTDEYYIMANQPYAREKVHVILSIDPETLKFRDAKDAKAQSRSDRDYPVSWTREEGQGRVFYTSLGHRKETWKDERFQKHLLAGLNWSLKKP